MSRLPISMGVTLVLVLLSAVHEVKAQQTYGGGPRRTEWEVLEFPDPYAFDRDEQRECGRTTRSSVCDPNGIISNYGADEIDKAIDEVYKSTICQCYECEQNGKGYIIRVAIMPKMKRIFPNSGNSSYMRLRDAQMYSYILSTRWKMEGLCNESLLILYSKYDDILYTLTRQGTSRALPDADVKRISLGVRSYFDQDETIAQGILEMIRRYKNILKAK